MQFFVTFVVLYICNNLVAVWTNQRGLNNGAAGTNPGRGLNNKIQRSLTSMLTCKS